MAGKGGSKRGVGKVSPWSVRDRARYSVAEHSVVRVHSLAFVIDQQGRVESVMMVHPTDGIHESASDAERKAARLQQSKLSRAKRVEAKLATVERKRKRKGIT